MRCIVAAIVPVLLWLRLAGTMPFVAYLFGCWLGLSILRVRTFLEHQAHERAGARSVIIEDRGPLALIFLNNNYHAVHHAHPRLALVPAAGGVRPAARAVAAAQRRLQLSLVRRGVPALPGQPQGSGGASDLDACGGRAAAARIRGGRCGRDRRDGAGGIAALPMYDWPEARGATDRLWAAIRDGLRAAGSRRRTR